MDMLTGVLLLELCLAAVPGELDVLPGTLEGIPPSHMMRAYLGRIAQSALDQRDAAYETLKTPEDLAVHKTQMRAFFIDQLGGLPERTPLNARVVGVDAFPGFRVERVLYESMPGYFVTGLCYLPESPRFPPPYPAVLVLCGHLKKGVGKEAYHGHCALLARNGFAVFCIDTIGQGERHQVLEQDGTPRLHSSLEHMHVGVGSILVGRNAAMYFIWDAMRALDYLEMREDIDPARMGCLGGSGGGTQTAYLMALDDRIKCASPRNYMTSLRRLLETMGPQDAEQNIHAQIAAGMGHGDFMLMAMPCAVLLLVGTHDSFDIGGAWQTFREAKRAYARQGISERVDILEADAGHGATPAMLTGLVRWFRRWLQGIDDAEVLGQDLPSEPENPMHCTPQGQVMLLNGARSTFELDMALEERLAEERRRFWKNASAAEARTRVRDASGIRVLGDLPPLRVQNAGAVECAGYRIEKQILEPEPGIWLPALLFRPHEITGEPVLYLHGKGKGADAQPGGPIEQLTLAGHAVLAVDLRGLGETERADDREDYVGFFGASYRDACLAYMLGKSFLAMRTEDILACARFLREHTGAEPDALVQIIAIGEAGPPALHAVALEEDLFASLVLCRSLVSWADVVRTPVTRNQLTNVIHGVLKSYDLPDLLALIPPDKVEIHEALNAAGKPVSPKEGV